MEQNKISRRNFLRVAGASATAAAMSGLVPAASAAGIKDLWSMDLQILATSDTHGKFVPCLLRMQTRKFSKKKNNRPLQVELKNGRS